MRHDTGTGDRLAVDDEGHLWVALLGGSALHRYDPAGRLVERVEVPVSRVTSCCFADGRLFMTTASTGLEQPEPDAGRLFVAEVGATGPAVRPFLGALPGGPPG